MASKPVDMSVVICTYNRVRSLGRTLESLREMSAPAELTWELIIVDNDSEDNTREVVEEFARTSGLNVRYVFEPLRGLSNARNAGIRAARGEVTAMIDDDILVTPNWLSSVWKEFASDTKLMLLGGRVELANPRDLAIGIITCTGRRVAKTFFDVEECIGGCNWALRNSVLRIEGEFDTLLGPGTKFRNGEDLDYKYRISKGSWKILYAPSAFVFHDHGRRTPEVEKAVLRDYDIGRGAFYAKHSLKGDIFATKMMYWTVLSRARDFARTRDMASWNRMRWVIAGFIGYMIYRAIRRLKPHGQYLASGDALGFMNTSIKRDNVPDQ